ncbi:hypothetical protein BTIS_1481 [Bifidobacterium tissieri]|uniref:Uncharacterized protein n=1 Tax=Bifidobacterium tissieri TaxID=1630162 RepID=A0A261FE16_9BIFI|nr:hypothetical protein BTIS_1481 [Bifidobacterium tissieri]
MTVSRTLVDDRAIRAILSIRRRLGWVNKA